MCACASLGVSGCVCERLYVWVRLCVSVCVSKSAIRNLRERKIEDEFPPI